KDRPACRGRIVRKYYSDRKAISMSNLGIKSRVLFLAIIPILIVAILLTSYSISSSLNTLGEAMRERGRIIATQLAPASEYGVVSGNHAMLQLLVQQAMTN